MRISDVEWMLSNVPQFLKFFVGVKFFNVEYQKRIYKKDHRGHIHPYFQNN